MKEEQLYSGSSLFCPTRTELHLNDEDSIHGSGKTGTNKSSASISKELEGQYSVVAPNGAHIQIPKELFVSLVDFMQTRKSPGSITIQFRDGEIVSVEAVAKKTYRNS